MTDPAPSSRRRRSRPTAVADVISRIVGEKVESRAGPRRGALVFKVFAAFGRLGPPLTNHAEPTFFRGGSLTLVVDDPTWLTELTFLKPEILARLEQLLGGPVVKEIRMRLGTLEHKKRRESAKPPELSIDQRRRLEALLEPIASPEVKEAVRRAARWVVAKRK